MRKRWIALLGAMGVVCVALVANAQINNRVTAATITTVSGNCLAQNNFRVSLTLDASAASANIGYCEGASCTAAIGTTGTTTLVAGTKDYWPADGAPKSAFCFISASGSQPLTIREGFK
jgi:hypothetical protein